MADSNLLIVLTVFVALCALSQAGQFLILLGLYRKVRSLHEEAKPLLGKAEATLESAKLTIDDTRKQLNEISTRANAILDSAQVQLARIDGVVSGASERAKIHLDRIDLVLGDTLDRVQTLVATTQQGLLKPVREVTALLAGIRSAFGFLFRNRRPSVAQATQDEEMFI
jgi:hypothetical protein